MELAVIVGANLDETESYFLHSLEELKDLANACNIEVCDVVTQNIKSINPKYYVGKGKLEEIKSSIDFYDANTVIFNDELSPSQIREIEKVLEVKIIDRSLLILEIFETRAKTTEAKLQVEIAELKYMLPRLIGLRQSMSRQVGGAVTNRGIGEKKLELDRRKISKEINTLEKKLKEVVKNRHIQREQRKKNNIPVIALVGYTNSGKSTLFNTIIDHCKTITDSKVLEKDMLFATLETTTRYILLPSKNECLITDTVGFISKLPHALVESFKSTLEEVTEADLILHIVDSSNPQYLSQIETTSKVLEEIGVKNIPIIYVYNKLDLIETSAYISKEDPSIFISAKQKDNINELIQQINQELFGSNVKLETTLPFSDGNLFSYLKEKYDGMSFEYTNDGYKISVELTPKDYEIVTNKRHS